MRPEVKVSIVVPVYNCEKTIIKTLKSILIQSYSDLEILIGDDGSTDDTLSIILGFHDSRIRVFADNQNKGISYRLNQLIYHARGKYIVRMDGDDLMFPDRVKKQVEYLENHPKVDAVGSAVVVIDEYDKILGMRGGAQKSTWNLDKLFFSSRFIHPTVTGKTEWFKKWKYKENMSGCEDMDLWIRSYNDSTFGDIDEPLLFYRDPVNIRLKTYLNRQKQILKCHWALTRSYHKPYLFVISIIKIAIKVFVSIVVKLLFLDKKWLKRRNQSLTSKQKSNYEKMLRNLFVE